MTRSQTAWNPAVVVNSQPPTGAAMHSGTQWSQKDWSQAAKAVVYLAMSQAAQTRIRRNACRERIVDASALALAQQANGAGATADPCGDGQARCAQP